MGGWFDTENLTSQTTLLLGAGLAVASLGLGYWLFGCGRKDPATTNFYAKGKEILAKEGGDSTRRLDS